MLRSAKRCRMRKRLGSLDVPLHLRNAPTRLMKQLGYGKDYRYAHDEPDAYAAGENYFPEGIEPRRYYRPVPRGLEIKIAEALGSGAASNSRCFPSVRASVTFSRP